MYTLFYFDLKGHVHFFFALVTYRHNLMEAAARRGNRHVTGPYVALRLQSQTYALPVASCLCVPVIGQGGPAAALDASGTNPQASKPLAPGPPP